MRRLKQIKSQLRFGWTPFYRVYPYRKGLLLTHADRRGMVDLDRGIFYCRVPKAANSTIVAAITPGAGLSDSELIEVKESYQKPSELSYAEMQRLKSCFKFTVVRHPYTRALSAYLDKVVSGEKHRLFDRFGGPPKSFEEFCIYLSHGGLYENAHWAPMSALMLMPVDALDFIGRVETLSTDLPIILKRAGISKMPEFSRAGPPPTHASALLDEHLTPRSRSILNEVYATDFRMFGY